jgi:hypothetical protein
MWVRITRKKTKRNNHTSLYVCQGPLPVAVPCKWRLWFRSQTSNQDLELHVIWIMACPRKQKFIKLTTHSF